MSGGGGADTFLFASAAESPRRGGDTVLDFQVDRLSLRLIDADPDLAGDQAFAFLGRSAFTGAGGEVRYAFANGDTLILADIDGDRRADLQVTLDGVVALTAGDLIL